MWIQDVVNKRIILKVIQLFTIVNKTLFLVDEEHKYFCIVLIA